MESSVCIEQKGTVEEISSHNIKVKICRDSSCGHCNVKGLCYIGESSERIIEINNFTPDLKTGDPVTIRISRGMGNKAIVLSYLIPFILLISSLAILSIIGMKEWLTGLLSLATLIPYFFILYLLRNRLSKSFTFSARKNVL